MSRVPLLSAAAAFVILAAAPPGPARGDAAGAAVKRGVDAWQAADYPAAIAAWRPAAERGDADAQFDLAQAYKLGRGVPVDLHTAQDWYRKAAVQGHEQAQATLGLVMFQGGDRAGAMPWLQKAADRGEPRAQYVYGTALFNGDVVPKDWPRAYALMTRAAASGLPQAKASLAQMDQFIPLGERQRGNLLAAGTGMGTPAAPPPADTAHAVQAMPPAPPPRRVAAAAPAPVAPRPAPPARIAETPVVPTRPSPKPIAKPAAPARSLATAGGGWRIQLGAFGNRGGAEAAWRTIAARGTLRGLSPVYIPVGTMTRLQAGPLADKAAAAAACRAAGATCFPVAP